MSEIRIIHHQAQQLQSNTVVPSKQTEQFVENLRIGQNLNAKLLLIDNKHWLVVEGIKIFIPKETVEQWNLQENQMIKLKVKSVSDPVELQIINNKSSNKESPKTTATTQTVNTEQHLKSDSSQIIKQTAKQSIEQPVNKQPLIDETTTPLNKNIKTEKVDAEKIILEARKFLNKSVTEPILKPGISNDKNSQLKNTDISNPLPQTKSIQPAVRPNSTRVDIKLKTTAVEIPLNKATLTLDKINQSVHGTDVRNNEKPPAASVKMMSSESAKINTMRLETSQPKTSIAPDKANLSTNRTEQTIIKSEPTHTVIKQKNYQLEQPSINRAGITLNNKKESIDKPTATVNKLKFEIPVKVTNSNFHWFRCYSIIAFGYRFKNSFINS